MRLTEGALPIGEPIPWDLCNGQGRVMFRQGFVVNTRASRERILAMDLYIAPDSGNMNAAEEMHGAAALQAHTVVGPLRKIEQLADCCSELFAGICHGPPVEVDDIHELAVSATRLYAEHPDTCLVAVHFNFGRSFQSLHAIYSLFLAGQVVALPGDDDERHAMLSRAALTANLGMFEYHDEWAGQAGPLSDEQRSLRDSHPQRSVERLRALGVGDEDWLSTVARHHELADGSGYPAGLCGDDVPENARIIGLVDRYLAWVLPRAGRSPAGAAGALRTLYNEADKYGRDLTLAFIKAIGVYPPGSAVELANGEIAVVVRRSAADTAHPKVVTVKQQDDRYSSEQPLRDTRDERYRIVDFYMPARGEVNPALMIKAWY